MNRNIQLNIVRRVPVFTIEQLSQYRLEDLQKSRRIIPDRKIEYGLPPYFFAQTKTKALVFTSPYKSLVERLEVIGESKRMFKNIPVTFEKDGMPLLEAVHQLSDLEKTPSPQLLLRFAES